MKRLIFVLAILAGCSDTLPVEAFQVGIAACQPHEGLSSVSGTEYNGGNWVITATCKSGAKVTITIRPSHTNYSLV